MAKAKRRIAAAVIPSEEEWDAPSIAAGMFGTGGKEPPVPGWHGFTEDERRFLRLRSRRESNLEAFKSMGWGRREGADKWLWSARKRPLFKAIYKALTSGTDAEQHAARVAIERAATLDIGVPMVDRLKEIIEHGQDRDSLGAMNLFVKLLGGLESVETFKPKTEGNVVPFEVRRFKAADGSEGTEIKVG